MNMRIGQTIHYRGVTYVVDRIGERVRVSEREDRTNTQYLTHALVEALMRASQRTPTLAAMYE